MRDWPSTPMRGVVEGFFGLAWSQADRLDQLDFYGAHKMNMYIYGAKEETKRDTTWRDPYTTDELTTLKELVDRANANHVTFVYSISPGGRICFSSDDDFGAVVAKFQSVWDLGVHTFSIQLDDVQAAWTCDSDATFGDPADSSADAQSYMLSRIEHEFIDTHAGAALQFVPTEYSVSASSTYTTKIASNLPAEILVGWTGTLIASPAITVDDVLNAKSIYAHPLLLWDNFPVNDYMQSTLQLGPIDGREPGVLSELAGITSNPMNEAAASKIPLFTVADYAWNDAAYETQSVGRRSADER